MPVASLDDLFRDGLRDIYYAEKQIMKSLGQLSKKVQSDKVREAMENHRRETQQQVQRIEQVMEMIESKPRAKKCAGIDGILSEGNKQIDEIDDEMVRDAAIVGSAQAIEHYEIARYGTLIAWAQQLGHEQAAELLEETLTEEKASDELLSQLAEAEVNAAANSATSESEEDEAEDGEEDADEDADEQDRPKSRRKSARG